MSKQIPGLASLSLLACLSGCALGPDYLRPAAPVPAHWPAPTISSPSRETATPGAPVPSPDWRSFFPDPRLQSLIVQALEHNRDLRIATLRIDEARALHGIQRADRLPSVDVSGSRSASLTPADLSTTGRQANAQRYDAGVGILSFELDFWGRVRRLNEAALANYLSSEEAQRAFRLSLIADVANAYYSRRELEERLRLARATVDSRGESRNLTGQRSRVGISSDLDFLQADGAFEAARADLANLERSRAAAENLLHLLVGQPPAGLGSQLPAGLSLSEQGLAVNPLPDLPAEVLLRRPDVLAAEQKLISANANIGAARAAFLPRVTLTGALGTASRSLDGLFDAGSGAWSFQPVLRLPLFDAGRTEANVDLATARKNIAVAEYEKAIQQAFREVADLLAAREQLGEQLRALERADKIQAERLRLTEARYKAGVANYLEVLDAQRESYAAQQGAVQTRRLLLSAVAQLYKALGG